VNKLEREIVIISMCGLGVPCQYRARAFSKKIIKHYMKKYILIPICPEQLGGLPTPRVACHIEKDKVIGKDKRDYTIPYIKGAKLSLKIAKMYGVKRAYLKKGSPSCGKDGITRKLFEDNGIKVYQI
jgi:uncharacterized protein YbbK (DUF523 family)